MTDHYRDPKTAGGTEMRTVTNVAITKGDPSDTCYRVQVSDDRVDPFIIEEFNVIRIIDELVEDCSWSAEVMMVPGLVPYLKAHDIFSLDVTPNGFAMNTDKLRGEDSWLRFLCQSVSISFTGESQMFHLIRSILGSYSRRPEPSIDQPPEYFPGDADRPEIQAGITRKDFEFWRVDASGRQWFRRKRQPKADTRSVIRGVES